MTDREVQLLFFLKHGFDVGPAAFAREIEEFAQHYPELVNISPVRGGWKFPEERRYFWAELTEKGKEVLNEIQNKEENNEVCDGIKHGTSD